MTVGELITLLLSLDPTALVTIGEEGHDASVVRATSETRWVSVAPQPGELTREQHRHVSLVQIS